jgi:hypothetical protein
MVSGPYIYIKRWNSQENNNNKIRKQHPIWCDCFYFVSSSFRIYVFIISVDVSERKTSWCFELSPIVLFTIRRKTRKQKTKKGEAEAN